MTESELEDLINDFYSGNFSATNLPVKVYNETVERLVDAVVRGFGTPESDDLVGLNLFENFEHNVGAFSAAKTHQQALDIQRALLASGKKISFSDFKKEARKIFDQYNVNWLKTEYATAYNQSIGAKQWLDAQADKDIAPIARFDTAGDERVRKEHSLLDGIYRHLDDAFWDKYWPPLDWYCRCDVTTYSEDEAQPTPSDQLENLPEVPKLFAFNPAKEKVIFSGDHPYFKVEDRYQVQAVGHFGLPVKPKPAPLSLAPRPGERIKVNFDEHLKTVLPKIEALIAESKDLDLGGLANKVRVVIVQYNERVEYLNATLGVSKYLKETDAIAIKRARYEIESKILKNDLEKARLELVLARKSFNDKLVNIIAQDEPLDLSIKLSATAKEAKGGFIDNGVEYFRRIVGRKVITNKPPVIKYLERGKRAHFIEKDKGSTWGEISLNSHIDVDTVCHELGHWFELSNPAIKTANRAFFERRTAGLKARRLRDIKPGSGYDYEEIAIEDDFIDPYSGKIYGGDSYETLTMWFSHVLESPESLENFIKNDLDHFTHYLRFFYEN